MRFSSWRSELAFCIRTRLVRPVGRRSTSLCSKCAGCRHNIRCTKRQPRQDLSTVKLRKQELRQPIGHTYPLELKPRQTRFRLLQGWLLVPG